MTMRPGTDLHNLFHECWGQAVGGRSYRKLDWLELERQLDALTGRVDDGDADVLKALRAASADLTALAKLLREENAEWREKFVELEAKVHNQDTDARRRARLAPAEERQACLEIVLTELRDAEQMSDLAAIGALHHVIDAIKRR